MKWSLRFVTLILVVVAVAGCGTFMATRAVAASSTDHAAQTVTVFVDATFGFRKNHMAHQLSKSHAEYAAKGYHFAQMVAYNENGDLEGFFVTYVHN